MKVRNGFVSNSSSTSFLIYGVRFDGDYSLSEKLNLSPEQSEYVENSSISELLYKEKIPQVHGEDGDDAVYIGISLREIQDDETGRQFKDRVEKQVREGLAKIGYTGNLEFDIISSSDD